MRPSHGKPAPTIWLILIDNIHYRPSARSPSSSRYFLKTPSKLLPRAI